MKKGFIADDIAYSGYEGPRLDREIQRKRMLNVIRYALTETERMTIEGIYVRGLSVTELAAELGRNKSTVCRNLARAKRRLRMLLKY